MAEGLLFCLAEGIIVRLCERGVEELGLLWSVKDLEKLKNIVSTIKAVLLDAEEKQDGNYEIKEWLEKLTDAFYEADDLLDDFSTEALRREVMTRGKKAKEVRIFFSKSNQLAYRFKMGPKIKAIIEKLDAIADVKKFHLEERPAEKRVWNRERDNTHSFVCAEEVIGRNDDKRAVVELLMDSKVEDNVSILPIVGIGGLGKTTLAQLVFNHEAITKSFQLRMWVCVSDDFDVKKIVGKILESATNQKPEDSQMNTWVNFLKKEIDGKKYLLVLDDVWNENREKWFKLKQLLMGGARGSKILVTTREEKVAKITRTVQPYSLKGLGEHESWSLFKQMAFEKGQEPENSRIVAIGKEIAKKCVGVPLAIRTIGRLLYLRNTETEWLSFKDNELSRISQDENDIIPTLKLSYDQLPSHLKHCFAYCSLFPKDHQIDKSTLINLWIAQGFIQLSGQNQCLEDVAHEYFMDLLWRSFFQEVEMDWWGDVIRCKMHDLMHDLAISVAGPLITRLEDNNKEKQIDERSRHVLVGYDMKFSSLLTSLSKATRIRTFLLPSGARLLNQLECDAIFSSLKLLRALELHKILNFIMESSICELKHLRYLDLSRNLDMKKLPDSITKLQNLQTLILRYCDSLEEWPRDFKRLVNLRHLDIRGCFALTYMPRGLGELTNLRSLSEFVVPSNAVSKHSGGLNELNGLNYLCGDLRIIDTRSGKDVEVDEYKAANLKNKQHLRALELVWYTTNYYDINDEIKLEGLEPHSNLKRLYLFGYGGVKFPGWLLSLTNLVEFELRWCRKLKYLQPLSQLNSLKSLTLTELDALEYISESGDGNEFTSSSSSSAPIAFFPSLEKITLDFCQNLKGWRREHLLLLSFPRLSALSLSSCPARSLQQTIMGTIESPTSTTIDSSTLAASSFTLLPKLNSMEIFRIEDLQILPEEGLRNLTSLEYLCVSHCPRLESLSQGMQYLTALQELKLASCDELDLGSNDEDGMQWQGLKSLLSLEFLDLPKLVSLPLGLQHVTTLQKLQISNCLHLVAIPEWIRNFTSLQQFEISNCFSLTSLPEGMCLLKSLQWLRIKECPILLPRCERGTGEDWSKIAHIPQLDLDLPFQRENSDSDAST